MVNSICLDRGGARVRFETGTIVYVSTGAQIQVAACWLACRGHCRFTLMSGLVSPRPVPYNSFSHYARNIPQSYADSPVNVGPGLTIHTPSQGVGPYPGASPAIPAVAHEEQKVYGLVIDLLNPEKRESALLELSKKREQYDDLALVLWHSFGEYAPSDTLLLRLKQPCRYHARASPRDRVCVSVALSAQSHGTCVESRVQCACSPAVRRVSS